MSGDKTTMSRRPLPNRPRYGLLAWEATIGYMSTHHSPDAMLKLQIYPVDSDVYWAALASWGPNEEFVEDRDSLAAALRELWLDVATNHTIFHSAESASKSPIYYEDDEWLDERTADSLDRLLNITQVMYKADWHLILIYQPVENPETRVQARLLAENGSSSIGGRGPSLRDACHMLYQNIARLYAERKRKKDD